MKNWIPFRKTKPSVSVVRLQGVITSGGRGLDDASLAPLLKKAFSKGKPSAVALVINSPGGSPVQSSLIGARIRRLSQEKDIPVFAFVEDVAASGGYWLASAADEIFVDPSSVVGSIGVISAGFGLNEAIGRYGVERRVYTAGKSKSMLDPFQAEKPADVKRLKGMLEQIHNSFKSHVSERRAGKLDETQDLFTGEIWVGAASIEVGLADAVGHLVPVMKDRFGEHVKFRSFDRKRSLFQRFGAQLVQDTYDGLEERAAYARFGL
jgi:serine protease SohB